MLIRKHRELPSSEITPKGIYHRRREFLQGSALALLGALAPGSAQWYRGARAAESGLDYTPDTRHTASDDEITDRSSATHYNNFYEFGFNKEDPVRNAQSLKTRPWTLVVEGEAEKPGSLDIEDILSSYPLEERIYRLRCVEAWSMVIPWVGFPLADLLRRFQPTSRAKYVAFETLHDPEQMPGQRTGILDWPYREGLRMDEAMHPLTLLTLGMYGDVLPNQNGAPLRLVVPWKYGFKSIKSIVRIRLTETEPPTSWNLQAPGEYGFYANVNPEVDHPRWSQKRERRIGEFFKRDTLAFNGYGDEVGSLYAGMDLKKHY